MRVRQLRRDAHQDRGQLIPGLLLIALAVIGTGLILFEVGVASTIRARAQTGADAAALATLRNIERQIPPNYLQPCGGRWLVPTQLNYAWAREEAHTYAHLHDTQIIDWEYDQRTFRVRVRVQSNESVQGRFWRSGGNENLVAQAEAAAQLFYRPEPTRGCWVPVGCDEDCVWIDPPSGSLGINLSSMQRLLIRVQ